jgi:L-ascorbate metabolism protein UlaG (beta-lactamase superfamily)
MKSASLSLAVITALAPLAARAAEPKPKTEITWYGHSAFVVKTPRGTVLAIDPWLTNPSAKDKEAVQKLDKVDYILVTHGHGDHVGDTLAIAQKTGARLVTNFDLSKALVAAGYPKEQATVMTAGNIGGTIALTDEVSVTLVPAVHSSTYQKDEATPVAAAGNPHGLVVRIQGGPTIYHTGDTDVTGDMKLIGDRYKPDLMLACIGGHFTMDPAGAALAATLVRPKQIISMHFGTFPVLKGTPAALEKELKARGSRAKVVEMQIGETRAL